MHDDRHVLISSNYRPQNFHPVHNRHDNIEYDEARLQMLQHQDGLGAIGRMLCLVTLIAQYVRKQLHKIRIVIDDQNYLLVIVHDKYPLGFLSSLDLDPVFRKARFMPRIIDCTNPGNITNDVFYQKKGPGF
ncbi:MAG: hypothetical protein H6Q52_763 [Deltaproteobacteria bacterium]|nr:hypothetical protein [Deltaproteobacteria bacterium]